METSVDELMSVIGVKEFQLMKANRSVALLTDSLAKAGIELAELRDKVKAHETSNPTPAP